MFGHGGPSAAPVSKNYPEMRERLRLLLSKKKKNKQQHQHEATIQTEPLNSTEQQRKSSSSSICSSKSSSVARSKTENKSSKLSTTDENAVAGLAAMSKRYECNAKSEQLRKKSCEEQIPTVSLKHRSESIISNGKENLSHSSSKSSIMTGQGKSNLNQNVKQNPLNKSSTTGNVANMDQNLSKSNSHNLSNISILDEQESKIKDVDELLDYIEGNQKAVANDKKKAKKERQKQQRLEELRKKEEEEKKLKEEQERERQRLEEEKKRQEEEERLRYKKMNKKAAQKAKKLAAKGLPVPSNEIRINDNLDIGNKSKMNSGKESMLDPIETLENLKAQHLKELQQLQQLHRQQLEEEHKKLVKKQEEQFALQRKQQVQGKLGTDRKEKKKGKNNSKTDEIKLDENTPMKLSNSVQASAYKTLAEAAQNPGNQIKITRMPNGGVEFSTVPANKEHSTGSSPTSAPQVMGKTPAPPPYLQEIFNRNPSIQPNIPSNMVPQNSHGIQNESESNRPCVPSKSNQPMVTIRRVENSNGSDPTVTISMKQDQLNAKNNFTSNNNPEQDKLLYTLVNGKILKPGETPNKAPQATNSASNVNQKHSMNVAQKSTNVNSSYPSNTMTSTRPPLPLDSNGKVDLNRLELPSGISITKVEGQAPERRYFPSKPSETHDQSILPLPGQHESQRGMFANVSNSRGNISNQMPQSPYSVNNVGQFNIPGIGPTNPNNVIVVDTSSLAESSNSKKGAATQNPEKLSKKAKKKSKLNQQQSRPVPSPPQSARKLPLSPSSVPQQPKASIQQVKPSQNTDKRLMASSSNPSISGDLKSGPQVLIKNVNGRVVITPVPGTGSITSADDTMANRLDQNRIEKSKSMPDASKSVAMSNVDKSKTTIKIGCSEINEINQRQGTQLSASGQQLNKGPNSSSSSKQNPTQRSTSSNKTLINSNGVDSSCLNLSSKPETAPTSNVIENKRNECHINEALKPIHNKLSKSVNDVENVGGRKRSKKNSIGDNFEDLSKFLIISAEP